MMKIIDAREKDLKWIESECSWRKREIPQDKKDTVVEILRKVKCDGDKALQKFSAEFDNFIYLNPLDIVVSADEIEQAYLEVEPEFIVSIRKMKRRIHDFHQFQIQKSWLDYGDDGSVLGQKIEPMEIVGVYVPGGRAAYPSSVLMNIIPAKIAGVRKIIMVSPPSREGKLSPHTLVAAKEAGCDMIFKIGGAHAIAALAYGTDTVPRVDKIVGPGNIYVTLAKKEVYGEVDIDMIAGPSEVLIVADNEANPIFVAADLLAQAEHDPMASAILLTDSLDLVEKVTTQIELQKTMSSRIEIIEKSLNDFGAVILLDSISQAYETANLFAPEHLELCVKNPFEDIVKIKHAGAIFLGNYSPEAIGDYMAGPNHVLPTNGTARFFSPLSVDHFVKKSSIIFFTPESLDHIAHNAISIANAEGLFAHANSVKVRLNTDVISS